MAEAKKLWTDYFGWTFLLLMILFILVLALAAIKIFRTVGH